jgi:uncharacterized paraquat-inducible protein A
MHTKDIEYAISMVAHPKALIIRAKALAQLNELLNRILELEAAQQGVQADGLTICQNCGGWLKGGECENCNSPLAGRR